MNDEIIWNGFTQAALDAAYNNSAAVSNSAELVAGWTSRSVLLRERQPEEIDIPYGPDPRTRFDIFRCGRSQAPLLVFIHGGWWQRNSKEVFSCMAEGPMARGFDVALLGYTLAPVARLEQIAEEIRAGIGALMDYQTQRSTITRCILSGWSAGGHLTALTLDHPAVVAGLSISGVFDLEPIRYSYINEKLSLDELGAAMLSPALLPVSGKPIAIVFGLEELPELQRQSADYGKRCAGHGSPAIGFPLSGHNHFSILEELASPKGSIVDLLEGMSRGLAL